MTASIWALSALLLLACARSPYEPATQDPATIYMDACSPCHLGGPSGPSLAGRNLTPARVESLLRSGGKGMPSFPGIRGEARQDLIRFVVRLSQPEKPASP